MRISCCGWRASKISRAALLSLKASAAVLLAPMISLTTAISAVIVRRWLKSSKAPSARPVRSSDAQVVTITTISNFARIDAERLIDGCLRCAPAAQA